MAASILYVATSNRGKLRDFAAAADIAGFAIEPLPDLDQIPPPPENEPTFEGNARTKALYYSQIASGLHILADDSGLEVDALNGAPGVRSARYAVDSGIAAGDSDQANNSLLLRNLEFTPEADRTACYQCVLALARDAKIILTAQGTVEGQISLKPLGTGGFGYDPIFYIPSLGKTMAQIDLASKMAFSHRGRALRSLFESLATIP